MFVEKGLTKVGTSLNYRQDDEIVNAINDLFQLVSNIFNPFQTFFTIDKSVLINKVFRMGFPTNVDAFSELRTGLCTATNVV